MSALNQTSARSWIFKMIVHCTTWKTCRSTRTYYPDSKSISLSRGVTHASFKVFGLTRHVLEPTIYRTRGKRASQYTNDAGPGYMKLIVSSKNEK